MIPGHRLLLLRAVVCSDNTVWLGRDPVLALGAFINPVGDPVVQLVVPQGDGEIIGLFDPFALFGPEASELVVCTWPAEEDDARLAPLLRAVEAEAREVHTKRLPGGDGSPGRGPDSTPSHP